MKMKFTVTHVDEYVKLTTLRHHDPVEEITTTISVHYHGVNRVEDKPGDIWWVKFYGSE